MYNTLILHDLLAFLWVLDYKQREQALQSKTFCKQKSLSYTRSVLDAPELSLQMNDSPELVDIETLKLLKDRQSPSHFYSTNVSHEWARSCNQFMVYNIIWKHSVLIWLQHRWRVHLRSRVKTIRENSITFKLDRYALQFTVMFIRPVESLFTEGKQLARRRQRKWIHPTKA